MSLERPEPFLRPLNERVRLLIDFNKAHYLSIEKTIYYAMRFLGHEANFDFKKTFIKFTVSYRAGCNDNPSLAFTIDNIEFLPLDEVADEALKVGAPRLEEDERQWQKTSNNYLGLILVAFEMDRTYTGWCPTVHFRMNAVSEAMQLVEQAVIKDRWLQELQRMVNYGIVLRTVDDDKLIWRYGRLVKRGNRWRWEPLTPKMLKIFGFVDDGIVSIWG